MARKKSATKKAREAELAAQREEQLESTDSSVKKAVEEEFDSEPESSESEDEDDFGELITDDVEEGINKVLDAIRNNDETLLKSEVRFFKDPEEAVSNFNKTPKHKPIYLKDYHRMNLLSGNPNPEDEDEDNEVEDKPKTYQQEKDEERNELLSEIKDAFKGVSDDESDNDDDFLKKKDESPESKAPKRILPNPEVDEEKFLQEFAKQNAWIPHDGDKIINLDKRGEEADEEFDAAAEKFEAAYNFRYEDPNSAEIISYARNQATIRRNDTNGRRKKRDEEKAMKEQEKKEKEKAINKRKTEKVNKLTDILEQVKKEYGADINEAMVEKISASLLDKDFDDSQWDTLLGEIFNDDFYEDENVKPQWDEDDEIMKDFNPSGTDDEDGGDLENAEEDEGEAIEEPLKKKSKKEELKEKKSKKKEKQTIKELAEKAVESQKLKIIDEIEEEREGRSRKRKSIFKYREVSPETFGLTTREIFMADDAELNEFVGLKKLAPYRPKDQRVKDRRKLAKKKNLRDWRKKVFKNEEGPQGEGDEITIPVEADKESVSRKRKHQK